MPEAQGRHPLHISSQTPARRKGTETDAFACTKKVLDYAMSHKAAAIAVESVQPALEGAREIHDAFAQRHGYGVLRTAGGEPE